MISPKPPYNVKWLFLLIPLIGLFISAIFFKNLNFIKDLKPLFTTINAILMTGGLWIGCMVIVVFLWRKFPWEYYPVKHLVYEAILILLFTNLFSLLLYKAEVYFGLFENSEDIYIGAIITNLITLLITALHEAVFFYKQWKFNFSKSMKLQRDNIEAKYETLKTQINPHFLFNSLNSLTTLVEDNEKAVDYIQNLSEFLRYVLKSRDRELVLLRDEISILEKYISLQKSRFRNNLQVQINIPEDKWHYSLPPLVLQMLIENCIKHNIISKENPLVISIWIEDGWIHIENPLQKKNVRDSTGSGLRNIVERYKFFTTNEVKILETDGIFKVSIPLLTIEL